MPNQQAQPIVFGKYTLLERISHGGMAEVFRAKTLGEAGFERTVAIKLLLPQVAMDDEFVTMLIDEAKIAGQLSHANIAQIFDLGRSDDRYYIVQEYVPGRDLRAILRHLSEKDRRLSLAQSCHMMLKVCEGLDYAHNKRDAAGNPLNLVHRDISPQNVIASYEGEIKLIDFGIVKAEGRATRTLAGLVKGKFAYMSPEQLRGLPVDRRSDVFACGIVLHELLTGQPLFKRGTEFETLRRARYAEIEPPSKVNREVPPELDRIALRALARHVDDRYQTALAFRDELWEFVRSHGCFYSRDELATWMRETFPPGGGEEADDDEAELQVERSQTPPPSSGVKRLADLRAQPIEPPPLDYDESDPDSELPQDPDVYGDMMTLVDPGYQERFAREEAAAADREAGRSTRPMGSAAPGVRDLAEAALSQPDRAVFIAGAEDNRLAVGSDPSIDLGPRPPRRSPTEDEETTSRRPDVGELSATEPGPAARAGSATSETTSPLADARWVEPQTPTPTRERPRPIDPADSAADAASTTPYLPAMRGGQAGTGPIGSSPPADPIKEALAHAATLGPHSARLPGLPPARVPGEAPPADPPVTWRSPSPEQQQPAGGFRRPGPSAAPDPGARPPGEPGSGPLPMPGAGMPPGSGMPPGPSMSPLPGPGMPPGPSMSPLPGPGMPPGPSMSPLPGPPMLATPPGAPYPYPHPPHQAGAGRPRSRLFLMAGAILVLLAAAIASVVLAASGG